MTFAGEPTPGANRTMRILVIVAIAWVAYWAATGGLDEIPLPEEEPVTSVLDVS